MMAMVVGCAACDTERDLLLETIDLAEGEYYGLTWGGTQVERFHVVARVGTPAAPTGEVAIVSPPNREPCQLQGVAGYLTSQPRNGGKHALGSPSPARVGLFGDVNEMGRGTVSFSDVDCERTPFEIEDIAFSNLWRLFRPDLTKVQLAARTGDGTLWFVDPWAETLVEVAHDVRAVWPVEAGVFLVENGELVKRDLDGAQLLRTGSNVSELAFSKKNGDYGYVDDRALYVQRDGNKKKLASEACEVRTFDDFLRDALAYYSPCDERHLAITTREGKTYRYDRKIDAYMAESGKLFFTSSDESTTTLWMARSDAPDKPAELTTLPHFAFYDLWPTSRGQLLLVGRQSDNTLTLWQLSYDKTETPTELASNVVVVNPTADALALLHADGSLSVRDHDGVRELLAAEGVPRSGLRFAFSGKAAVLVYLSDIDPETQLGRLHVRFSSGEHYKLADDVREFREVWWPETGILYAQSGARPRLRFARVDIPCELISEYPWTCGF